MLSRLLFRRSELRHGQYEDSVRDTMLVEYEMKRYPAEVFVSAVSRVSSRVPLALQEYAWESCSSILRFFSFHSLLRHKALD